MYNFVTIKSYDYIIITIYIKKLELNYLSKFFYLIFFIGFF